MSQRAEPEGERLRHQAAGKRYDLPPSDTVTVGVVVTAQQLTTLGL
jgi:hypothetical protein